MSNSLRYSFLLSLLILVYSVRANAQFIQDDQGRPVLTKNYVDVQGSPFLFENWVKATVRFQNGKTYSDVPMKLDIVADKPYFKNPKDEDLLEFIDPVTEFVLFSSEQGPLIFRNGFKANEGLGKQNFYHVLFDGGTKLLKRKVKKIIETKDFNSASAVRSFEEMTFYYIGKDGLAASIRKDKKNILEVLGNHQAELESYIKEHKLNLKNEDHLIRLFAYYNSL